MQISTLKIFRQAGVLAALVAALSAVPAFAARSDSQNPQINDHEPAQCIALVRECFSYHGFNRSNCFFTSATHPFCEGTELGSLAYRRWVLSPSEPTRMKGDIDTDNQDTSAQAFLGPQVVDPVCIEKADDNLSSSLRIDSISNDTVRKLTASLENCRKDIGLELRRQ